MPFFFKILLHRYSNTITRILKSIQTAFLAIFLLSFDVNASDYGTTGLIDIPTARMSNDGELRSTVAIQSRTKSFAITYQATPWLEGTFRYTGFKDFFYWDRNYEVKALLWEEKKYLPQVAVGIRDLVGTAVWGSEYLVASKRIGSFDATIGMGWGRLAGSGDIKNPLTHISDSFLRRKNKIGSGGTFSTNTFFSGGKAGFFGGLNYTPDNFPISLMLEYNPDEYEYDIRKGGPKPKSQISAGIKWDYSPGLSFTLSRQHDQEWGIQMSASLDTKTLPQKFKAPEFISSLELTRNQLPPGLNKNKWYDMLLFDAERSGLLLVEASLADDQKTAIIVMGNRDFAVWEDALTSMINLLDLHLPESVEKLNIVIEEQGHRLQSITTNRKTLPFEQSREIIPGEINIEPFTPLESVQYRTNFFNKKVTFDYNVAVRTQLFDPDDPARYQIYGKLAMTTLLPDDWLLSGTYGVDITHNFDESKRINSNSRLQNVRTDIVKYLTEGDTGLDSLYLQKRGNWNKDLHYRLYGGILEYMYSGVGGEVLYQPFQSRLGYGFSANFVQQRDYDKSFKHLDYNTVTAFASVYYATPFYNFDIAMHAGKYLARDKGATFEVRRTFNNGWMVGLWATLTNVSAKQFGEGSFDKGMFFKIPLNGLLSSSRKDTYTTHIRPIQRDGGQRLEDFSGNIWWDTRSARYDAFSKTPGKGFFSGFSTKKKAGQQKNIFKY